MSTIIDTFVAPPCTRTDHPLVSGRTPGADQWPAGLLSLSGKDPRNLDSVHHRLVQRFPGCTLVHRLDFGTSGLMGDRPQQGALTPCCAQQFSQRTGGKASIRRCCAATWRKTRDSGGGNRQRSGPFPAHGALRPPRQTGAFALSGHRPPVSGARRREGAGVNPGDAHSGDWTDPSAAYSLPAAGPSDPLAAICTVAGSRPARNTPSRLMLHASELRFVHPVSHEPMHIQQASPVLIARGGKARGYATSGSSGTLKVGVRIVLILLIPDSQGAVPTRCCWRRAGLFSQPLPPE